MIRLLAVDTSSERGFIALYADGELRAHALPVGGARSPGISACAKVLLAECGLSPGDLTHLVAGAGPGKFIRTRVGISFVNGAAAALQVPVATVDSLSALAVSQFGGSVQTGAIREAQKGHLLFAAGLCEDLVQSSGSAVKWQVGPKVVQIADFLKSPTRAEFCWVMEENSSLISTLSQEQEIVFRTVSIESYAESVVTLALSAIENGKTGHCAGQIYAAG